MIEAPRDDLIRMVPLTDVSLRAEDDGNTLVGYPVVFNVWSEITGWEGNFMERVLPGAATKTIAERGDKIKVLFNHGFDPQIGDKPLGKPSVMEPDERGVWTETPFADTSYNDDLKELIKVGAIDGQSYRFSVKRDEWDEDPGVSDHNPKGLPERSITEFKWFEFGPVTFPAFEATTAGVRARTAYQTWVDAARSGTSTTPSDAATTGTSDVPDESSAPRDNRRHPVFVKKIDRFIKEHPNGNS